MRNSPEGYVQKGNRRLASLEDWFRFAPPKKKEFHWKDGRSAKECARDWIAAAPRLEPDIARTIAACPDIDPIHPWSAEPEAHVKIDDFRGPPKIDMLLVAEDDRGPMVVAIEAKADETFGDPLADERRKARAACDKNPRSKKLDRLEALLDRFSLSMEQPQVPELRYQLFTATAAAIAEAERRSSDRALIIVHEFVTPLTQPDKRERNAADLDRFLSVALGCDTGLGYGEVVGPFRAKRSPAIYFGKARTQT